MKIVKDSKYQCVTEEDIIYTLIDQHVLNLLNSFYDKVSALYASTSARLKSKKYKYLQLKGTINFYGA